MNNFRFKIKGMLKEPGKKKMKKTVLLFLAICTGNYIYSQSACNISEHYGDFIKIARLKSSYSNDWYLSKNITGSPVSCCSDMINQSIKNGDFFIYIDYLLTNFSSFQNEKKLLEIEDSTTLQKEYIANLQKDSLFNSTMNELYDKSFGKSKPRDTVTMNELLNIAVKFFLIMNINDKGSYIGKVCIGINGIKSTLEIRKPLIEAFCYASIYNNYFWNNYQGNEINLYDEFVKAIKEIYKLDLGTDKNEKLLRAQGAVFIIMRNNENLKKVLTREYEKYRDFLPFILK